MEENRIMTTKELAEYIKLNEKTVIKMAQNGQLPGVKIGNQWRFHLAAIDSYLQNGLVRSKDEDLDLIIKTAVNMISLSRLTDPDLINLNLKAKTRDEVLAELADMAFRLGLTPDKDKLFSQLEKRERMLSTAIGEGVAIPHPRHPSTHLFKRSNVLIACSPNGIDYGAPDGKPARVFFMTCAPNEFVHIRLLAKIAKLLHSSNIVEKFTKAKSKDDIIRILLEFEREQLFKSNH
ncbi:MAG: PTS sugar transporter subunit IIA [Candidatus Omnitrophota bacterium]